VLIEGLGLGDKRLEVKGHKVLMGKSKNMSAHSSSSLQ